MLDDVVSRYKELQSSMTAVPAKSLQLLFRDVTSLSLVQKEALRRIYEQDIRIPFNIIEEIADDSEEICFSLQLQLYAFLELQKQLSFSTTDDDILWACHILRIVRLKLGTPAWKELVGEKLIQSCSDSGKKFLGDVCRELDVEVCGLSTVEGIAENDSDPHELSFSSPAKRKRKASRSFANLRELKSEDSRSCCRPEFCAELSAYLRKSNSKSDELKSGEAFSKGATKSLSTSYSSSALQSILIRRKRRKSCDKLTRNSRRKPENPQKRSSATNIATRQNKTPVCKSTPVARTSGNVPDKCNSVKAQLRDKNMKRGSKSFNILPETPNRKKGLPMWERARQVAAIKTQDKQIVITESPAKQIDADCLNNQSQCIRSPEIASPLRRLRSITTKQRLSQTMPSLCADRDCESSSQSKSHQTTRSLSKAETRYYDELSRELSLSQFSSSYSKNQCHSQHEVPKSNVATIDDENDENKENKKPRLRRCNSNLFDNYVSSPPLDVSDGLNVRAKDENASLSRRAIRQPFKPLSQNLESQNFKNCRRSSDERLSSPPKIRRANGFIKKVSPNVFVTPEKQLLRRNGSPPIDVALTAKSSHLGSESHFRLRRGETPIGTCLSQPGRLCLRSRKFTQTVLHESFSSAKQANNSASFVTSRSLANTPHSVVLSPRIRKRVFSGDCAPSQFDEDTMFLDVAEFREAKSSKVPTVSLKPSVVPPRSSSDSASDRKPKRVVRKKRRKISEGRDKVSKSIHKYSLRSSSSDNDLFCNNIAKKSRANTLRSSRAMVRRILFS